MSRWVVGLDGCKGRWAAVFLDLDDVSRFRVRLADSVAEAADDPCDPVLLAVDIPIGLPDRTSAGGRDADDAARKLLGPARSSVFPVPPRTAVEAADYETAKGLARCLSEDGKAFSIQTWCILRYVRDVDQLLRRRPELVPRVREMHPEVAFFRLNGDRPLSFKKKTRQGASERRALLLGAGLPDDLVFHPKVRGMPLDDMIDALAAVVVARDVCDRTALCLPPAPQLDRYGIPIAIWTPALATGTG